MPRCLIKIKDWYLEWSTVSDAPVTLGMTLEQLQKYTKQRYGSEGLRELSDRVNRCDTNGTSWIPDDPDDDVSLEATISFNRAGVNETCLSPDQIVEMYCGPEKAEVAGHEHSDDDNVAECDGQGNFK